MESTAAPAMPPAITKGVVRAGRPAMAPATATKAAPAIAASHPAVVTPPDSPMASGRHVRTDRGVWPTRIPISVAHVSDADAASEPLPTANQNGALDGTPRAAIAAHNVNGKPFAITCVASRAPVLSTTPTIRE